MMKQNPATRIWNSRSFRIVRWLIVWLVLYVALIHLYHVSFSSARDVLVHRLQAVPAAFLINLTDHQARAVAIEELIVTRHITISILRGCDGFEAWAILISALISFPMPIKQRLIRAGMGTCLIFVLNQARIVTIYHVVNVRPDLFDLMHGLIWQSIMVLLAVAFVIPSMELQDHRHNRNT